jgi:hypothetical protein
MAELVLGLATSHSPLLSTPPDQWHLRAKADRAKNWLPVVAAMNAEQRQFHQVDYVPCYRSEAGTGNAMGFVYWD